MRKSSKCVKSFISLVVILTGLLFVGCSESDGNITDPTGNEGTLPELATIPDFIFTVPTNLTDFDSVEVDYNGESVWGFPLEQFISFEGRGVLKAEKYLYEMVSSDEDGNWSPRNQEYTDLNYSQFSTGYLLPTEKGRTFFPDESIETGYDTKYAQYFKLYHKIDVERLDGTIVSFETGALTSEEITYYDEGESETDTGISFTQFITDYITKTPENFNYEFTADDDFSETKTWIESETAYWMPENKERIIFFDSELNKLGSVKYLIKIKLLSNE